MRVGLGAKIRPTGRVREVRPRLRSQKVVKFWKVR